MSTYFVLYTKHGKNEDMDKTILVDSSRSGTELYEDILAAIDRFWDTIKENLHMQDEMISFTVKNIVCLDNVPGTQMPEQNPLRVTHPSRPDLEINLYVSGMYNDRMDVNVRSKDTGDTHSMCFELPADPRRL